MAGGKFALLIGSDAFRDHRLAGLSAPPEDVRALRDVLCDPQICGFSEPLLVMNGSLVEVRTAVSTFLAARHPDDLALVYYTGHGIKSVENQLYLALAETNVDTPEAASLEAEYLRGRMDACKSERQILILDCCHAAAYLDGAKRASAGPVIDSATFDPKGYGRFVMAASAVDESAFEIGGRSVYTRHLVEGLSTGNAAPAQKDITINALHRYVATQIDADRVGQEPHLWGREGGAPLILGRNIDFRPPLPEDVVRDIEADVINTRLGALTKLRRIIEADENAHQRQAASNLLEARLSEDGEDSIEIRREICLALGIDDPVLTTPAVERALREAHERHRVELDALRKQEASERQRLEEARRQLSPAKSASGMPSNRPWWFLGGLVSGAVIGLFSIPLLPDVLLPPGTGVPEIRRLEGELQASERRDAEASSRAEAAEMALREANSDLRSIRADFATAQTQISMLKKQIREEKARHDDEIGLLELRLQTAQKEPKPFNLPASAWIEGQPNADGSVFQESTGAPEMVVIPTGSFLMGSPKGEEGRFDVEGPQHRVEIAKPFALARTEVTFDQWQACVDNGGCKRNSSPKDGGMGRGAHPVINVSWLDAQQYIDWLNSKVVGNPYRLPSEAEWEYAARAGKMTRYSWNDEWSPDLANCAFSVGATVEVAGYEANAWGLHDMHGNVWEWVQDRWKPDYYQERTQAAFSGNAGGTARVIRGGSWFDYARVCRSAYRLGFAPGNRDGGLGFRPARGQAPGAQAEAAEPPDASR